ncbi:MAG TPA: hypothetical protein DEB40_08735 [Elusimicrobia bacterium]|nr:hypothetical protein [Elusimicrobiota bacterium]HBT61814.1 hypothetical protein [Elusimicrobiota bacterium]
MTVLLALWAVLCAAPAPAQGIRVWVADDLTSVKRDDPPSGATAASIQAAGNEYAGFQVVVKAPPQGPLSNVHVGVSDLSGPGVISSSTIKLYRAQYVPVRVRSPVERAGNPYYAGYLSPHAPRDWADALIPASAPGGRYESFPFSVPESSNQPVYVEIPVPKDAAAGAYRGAVTVTADGQEPVSVAVALTVWGFALPDQPALATDFLSYDRWLWVAAGAVGADQAALQENIWAALTEHRIGTTQAGEAGTGAWTGSAADRSFTSAWLGRQRMIHAPEKASARDLRDLMSYLSGIGRSRDIFVRCGDEPHSQAAYDDINRTSSFWRELGIPTQVTVGGRTSWDAFDADIWVAHHARLIPARDRAAIRLKQAQGRKIWSYYCCEAPRALPNWMLDSDPIDFRITPWLDFRSDYSGMLYWATAYWAAGAAAVWTNAGNGNGDGVLFYPGSEVGAPHAAIPSARLKAIRDGIEDYDYLALLRSLGGGAQARELAAGIARDWDDWSRDPAELKAARRQAAEGILRLLDRGGPVLPATVRPP